MPWKTTNPDVFSEAAVEKANIEAEQMRAHFATPREVPSNPSPKPLELGSFVVMHNDQAMVEAMLHAEDLSFRVRH